MEEISPKIPIEHSALKDALRKGLPNQASRYYWWPNLPNVSSTGSIESNPDNIGIAERLAALLSDSSVSTSMEEDLSKGKEREHIVNTANEVAQLLVRAKLLGEDEILLYETFLRLLVSVIKRIDVCCMLAGDLLANREKYLDPSPIGYSFMLNEFRETLSNFSPKTYNALFGIGALEDRFLDLIFRDFCIELLPPDIVLRIIDAYLLEGNRILFRYGLAIIRAYKTQIKANNYTTATNFWHAVKADATNFATKSNTLLYAKTIGREERIPIVDAFVIFSKAKNPEFLETNLINEYPYDEDRSMLSKFIRPMTLSTRKASFSSPLSALNNNLGPSSIQKTHAMRKASFTTTGSSTSSTIIPNTTSSSSGLQPRPSVANMILNQTTTTTNTTIINPDQSSGSMKTSPAPGAGSLLSRRGSASAAMFKDMASKVRGASGDVGNTSEFSGVGVGGGVSPAPRPADTTTGATAAVYTTPEVTTSNIPSTATPTTVQYASGGSAYSPVPGGAVVRTGAVIDLNTAATSMSATSNILTTTTATKLLTAIPQNIPLGGYHLVFSTTQHGYELSTLYNTIENCSPLILLIHLAPPYHNTTIGVYMSTTLYPHESCLGGPKTACFRINDNDIEYYPWVGLTRQNTITSTETQFLTARNNILMFGGSEEYSTNALRFDESLQIVYTGSSDTFNNPNLVSNTTTSSSATTDTTSSATASATKHGYTVQEVEIFTALPSSSNSTGAAAKCFADITTTNNEDDDV